MLRDDAAPTASARARAWSKPRSATRRRDSGTHVTTWVSAEGGNTATMAWPSAAATGRHPANFNRCTAWRAGP